MSSILIDPDRKTIRLIDSTFIFFLMENFPPRNKLWDIKPCPVPLENIEKIPGTETGLVEIRTQTRAVVRWAVVCKQERKFLFAKICVPGIFVMASSLLFPSLVPVPFVIQFKGFHLTSDLYFLF